MKKLTDWEAGQELVKVYDAIADARVDLRKGGHERLAVFLSKIANQVGSVFNELKSHEFGLPEDLK